MDRTGGTPAPRRAGGVPGGRRTAGAPGLRQFAQARVLAPVDDRDDCFAAGEVNHQALFGRVAAVVHHGGASATTAAVRVGMPQVVVPQPAGQPYRAGRVAGLCIGEAQDGPAPAFDSLSAALATALTPGTRARARAVAATIGTDGASVAAKLLLDGTSRDTRPGSA